MTCISIHCTVPCTVELLQKVTFCTFQKFIYIALCRLQMCSLQYKALLCSTFYCSWAGVFRQDDIYAVESLLFAWERPSGLSMGNNPLGAEVQSLTSVRPIPHKHGSARNKAAQELQRRRGKKGRKMRLHSVNILLSCGLLS